MLQLRKATFGIDSIPDTIFEGYTNGEIWNGWSCPYFEKSVAELVLRASESNRYRWTYSTSQDAFIVRSEDDPDDYEPEVFEAIKAVDEQNNEMKVYGIGAYSWIWELVAQSSSEL